MSEHFTPEDELDFTEDGFQTQEGTFIISKAEVLEHENGRRWQLTFEPLSDIDDLPGGVAKDSGYLSHTDEDSKALRIGRSILKRYGQSILGKSRFSLVELEGQEVSAEVSEDDNGFIRVRKVRSA